MKQLLIVFSIVTTSIAWAQTQRIEFEAPKVYPEGVAYYPKGKLFFVSSVTTGTIGTVDVNGSYKVFYKDSTMKSTYGLKVDEKRNQLWVCASDPKYSKYSDPNTFKKMARLICLDLSTGKKIADVDLSKLKSGKHFANDLALDAKGNVYVTDSHSPVIYKIDQNRNASIFAESDDFKSQNIGLNGIVVHPKGFLLAANNEKGILLKIDLKNPKQIDQVKTKTFFPGADGLLMDANGNLVLVQNKGVNKAFSLSSKDNWASAEVVSSTGTYDRFQNPTTATMMNNDIYVLNSKMNELSDSTMGFSKSFSVQLARMKPVK